MSVEQAARGMEQRARACTALHAHRYADLLLRAARGDIRAGGPCAEIIQRYADAPTSALMPLRLLGGVHALVLTGRAPQLARFYP